MLIPYVDNLFCCMGLTMLTSVYGPYFTTIHAEPYVARTTFVLIGISNILGKFFTGFFLDRYEEAPVICSMVGNALMLLPFLSLATLPYWHIEDYYRQWVVLGGSPLLSCGFAMIYIATFLRMYKIKLEHVDGQDTSTLISG